MTKIARGAVKKWSNYHETVEQKVGRLQFVDLDPADPPAHRLAETARLVGEELRSGRDVRPLGGSWSFSPLCATSGDVLSTRALAAVYGLGTGDLAAGVSPDRLRLVTGGTQIKQLNVALEAERLSLRTSGASNGQSVAGAMATGTHGSVPGFGGFQDHVRGIHLVTGPGRSIWLEPTGAPTLDSAFARSFADDVAHRDDWFDAALVHLGGVGYVNAVLLEAAPRFLVGVVQRKAILNRDAIEGLAAGRFAEFAQNFGFPDPYFVQIILNPFNPYTRHALIRLLIPMPEGQKLARIALFEGIFEFDPLNLLSDVIAMLPPGARGELIAILMRKLYPEIPKPGGIPTGVAWSATTPDHRHVGDLFSTAISIDRGRLPEALDAMLPAFRRKDGGDTVCTLRFVRKSRGTLAITRSPDNVVIDFDGLRSKASRNAYKRVLQALDDAQIPSRQHWGKLSLLDSARVERDHGEAAGRWRAARRELLPADMLDIFKNRALVDWGLA
jgi:hypothetical protein